MIQKAFPTYHGGYSKCDDDGMTLRDYFAAKAMASMLLAASTTENMAMLITEKARTNNFDVTAEEWISESAYAVADAMLEARQA